MEYKKIYKEFSKNSKFKKLKKEMHHGTSRMDHINRVAKLSYKLSKLFKYDYESTTRGALLHDFFLNSEVEQSKNRFKTHSLVAYDNALKYFKLNEIEKDIILKHMHPLTKKSPEYRESYLVSTCDKLVTVYELMRYQVKASAYFLVIFLFQFINLK